MLEIMSLRETAEYLGFSTKHLRWLRKQDGFPKPILLGKTKKAFRKNEIVEWVERGGLMGGEII
jgi:predicted DNA-binding transcriptional regulator AlpA